MTSSLASIENPIAIFSEHIASRPTALRFKNHGRGGSTITDITDETAHQNLFTIGAKQTGMTSSRREFRDSKDSLLFEMRRDRTGYYTFLERFHDPSHPFATFDPLATGCKDKFDVSLHRSARDGDSLLEPEIKLEVRGQDIWKKNALVYCGEDIIMQVRLVHLYTCYIPFKSNEWDVYVAKGMDLSLASAIVCYMAATLYDSANIGALSQADKSGSSVKAYAMYGALAGGAAGAAGGAGGSC